MKNHLHIRPRRGFTILELIIVIALIAVLIALLIPAVGYVRNQAKKASTVALLNAIGTGLEQYHADFGSFPPSDPSSVPQYPRTGTAFDHGGIMLVQGLTGYLTGSLDGAGNPLGTEPFYKDDPSLGFRTRAQTGATPSGKIYGPYIATGTSNWKAITPDRCVLLDLWGDEILYFRAVPVLANGVRRDVTQIFQSKPPPASPNPYTGIFVPEDNAASVGVYEEGIGSAVPIANKPDNSEFASLLMQRVNPSNNIGPGDLVLGRDSYLLVSAGPDRQYFTKDDIVSAGK